MSGRRRLARLLSALSIVSAAHSPAIAQAAPPPTEELSPALQTVRDCVAANNNLDVLLVVDESTSIVDKPGTDRENKRVDGVLEAIKALIELSAKSSSAEVSAKVDVSLMLAAFATDYTAVTPQSGGMPMNAFVPVSDETRASLEAAAQSFVDRNDGQDTDFGRAFGGAIESYVDRDTDLSAAGSRCKLLIVFTDGVLSLPGSGETGRVDELCAANGLADATRSAGIVSVGVALDGPWLQDPSKDPGLLERIVTGSDRFGGTCGTTGSPSTGLYLQIGAMSDLAEQIRNIIGIVDPPPPVETFPPCSAGSECSGEFSVPALAEGFTLTATAPTTLEAVRLFAPSGASVDLAPGIPSSPTISDTSIEFVPVAAGGFRLTGVTSGMDSGTWKWSITYGSSTASDAAQPAVEVQLATDVLPVVVSPTEVRAGDSAAITVELRRPSGSIGVVDGSTVALQWQEAGQTLDMVGPDADGRFSASIQVPADTADTSVTLRVDAVELRADDAKIILSGDAPLRLDTIADRLDPRARPSSLVLSPGQQAPISQVFHVVGHDLRRHPNYTVAVYVVTLAEGKEAGRWLTLRLSAPPEAPIGEHI